MIYITGDTHGDFARFSAKRLRRAGMELTQEITSLSAEILDCAGRRIKPLSIIVKILRRSPTRFCGYRGTMRIMI